MSVKDVDPPKESVDAFTYQEQPPTPQLLVFDIKSPVTSKRPSHASKPPINKTGNQTERNAVSALNKVVHKPDLPKSYSPKAQATSNSSFDVKPTTKSPIKSKFSELKKTHAKRQSD